MVLLDVYGVVFGRPHMYMWDGIFMRRTNIYHMIKDKKSFIINAHKDKSKISLEGINQAKKLIRSSRKFVLLLLKQNQQGG